MIESPLFPSPLLLLWLLQRPLHSNPPTVVSEPVKVRDPVKPDSM